MAQKVIRDASLGRALPVLVFIALQLLPGASAAVARPKFAGTDTGRDRLSRPHFPALPAKPPVDVFDRAEAGGLGVRAPAPEIRGSKAEWPEPPRDGPAWFGGAL